MEDVEVCRICLVRDVKMYQVHSFPIYSYFESIIGVNPLSTLDLPPYVCFECAMLLKKYYTFREKCMLGQSLLYGLLQTTGKISIEDLNEIDRKQLKLISSIQKSSRPKINTIFVIHDDEPQEVVKEEFEEANTKDETNNGDIEDPMTPLRNLLKFENDCANGNDDAPLDGDTGFHGAFLSSDDEPLLAHKQKKEKKKKIKKVKKEKESKVSEHLEAQESENSLVPAVPQKRKRGRPRKNVAEGAVEKVPKSRRTYNTGGVMGDMDDDTDLEEYCTIMKLSLEEQLQEIQARSQSSNYLNAPFQCSLCYKGFIDTAAWDHHRTKHAPSAGDMECDICKFRFKNRRALQKHAVNHQKKYACKACPYVSQTATQAKQHQRWHKGVTYKCQYCDEISTKWTSYLSHVRIKHPSEFICGACGYSFVSKLGLTMHITMMHKQLEKTEGDERGPYCEECDVKFISMEAYKRHTVTSIKHTQSREFNTGCRVCGDSFPSREELRLHHRKEHARKRPRNYGKKPNNTSWPVNCEHCSEVIPNAREYWTHFRRAHPDQSYPIQKDHVCDICGKSFRGNAFLVYHKRTHSSERAYKCSVCGKAFFNRTNLQMHLKTHSDHRPYPCELCCKAFKTKGALDRHFRYHSVCEKAFFNRTNIQMHLKTHSDHRPYPCKSCSRAFKTKGALDRHFKSHTGVKPYECEVCGKGFAQSNSRKLHMRTVHLKLPAPYISRNRQEKRKHIVPQPAALVRQTEPQFIATLNNF